jgi:hypothetical protein
VIAGDLPVDYFTEAAFNMPTFTEVYRIAGARRVRSPRREQWTVGGERKGFVRWTEAYRFLRRAASAPLRPAEMQ